MSVRLPEPAFFVPGPIKQWAWEHRIHDAASNARAALHLAHAGCLDGAGSDLVARTVLGDDAVRTVFLEPHTTLDALDFVAAVPGHSRRLLITDLSLQQGQGERAATIVTALNALGWKVEVRDHHARQWDGAPLEDLRRHGTITLDLDGKDCGATLLARDLGADSPFLRVFLEAVRDHDLWIRKDPHALTLNDARRTLGSEAFVKRLLKAQNVDDPVILKAARKAAHERRALTRRGLNAARIVLGPGGVSVGVVYGDLPTNDVLHGLYQDRGADLAILFKPEGSFSLRSKRGIDVCHRVAQAFGGGGHPNAAGGTLGLVAAELPAYWAMQDRYPRAKAVVSVAFKEIAAAR